MDRATHANASYTSVTKALHWTIAFLVLLMLVGGWTVGKLPREQRLGVMQIHAGIGIIILVLMLVRLGWRLRHPAPPLPGGLPRWQQIASKATHHTLYLLIILQPLLGLALTMTSKFNLRPFGLFSLQVASNATIHKIGQTAHGLNAYLIAAIIALHVLAAFHHHFIRHDIVLKRMLPFVEA